MARHLCSNRSTPRCEAELLVLPDPAEPPIQVGSPAWQAWLAAPEHTLFYFADGPAGCTVRCELRRGKRYWYAYARHAGKLRKAYLGRAANLTYERLRTMAHRFLDTQMLTEAARAGVLPPAPPPRHASTDADLLTTKLNLPPLRACMLIRPRLIAHLDAALDTTLTLIAAPAGYGKTSLLVEWLASRTEGRGLRTESINSVLSPRPSVLSPRVAWLALDQADNDPTRFWRYLLAALERAQPSLVTEARALLRSASPIAAVLTCLLNRLAATPALSLVLALDDFHLIEAHAIHDGMAFLLDHAPPNLHVVLALRALPLQPLARLCASGQLIELRTTDLRFTQPELAAYLGQVMDLNLSDGDIAALDRSTEGWITGIQLAALSHQRAPGSLSMPEVRGHRAVLDYLAAEVFASLAPEMQAFLLDTAVLERFCAPLCDAVLDERPKTKDESSTSFVLRPSSLVLEELERANLFLVPLDAQRHWYRYHHLFAGFLRERLAHTAPQQVALLHGRAARWFEQQRLPSEAATHALAANDPVLAGRLVWMAAEDLVRQGEVLTLSGWIEALPHALVRQSAELSLWYAWALALTLRQDQVAPWLAQVERLSSAAAPGSEHAARLGQVAVVRATVCAGMGDLAGTIQHAQTALAALPDRDTVLRAVVALNLGTAQAAAGNLTAAAVALTEALALSHASAHHYIYAGAAYLLGRLRLAQGRLHEAARICRQAHSQLAAADQQLAAARISIALSTVFCEWNELAEAERLLGACMALIAQSGYAAVHLLGCLTQARIHWARGRVEQALVWLDQAECAAQLRQNMPDLHLVAAWRVRIGLSQGHLAAAEQWLAETGMALDAAPERERAAGYAVAAEVALARARAAGSAPPSAVVARLAQLHQQALADTRHADALTAGALLALVHQARGDLPAAQTALRATLALGAPEGAIRTLAELGPPLAAIIQSGLPRQAQSSYAQRLLNACLSQPSADQSPALLRREAGTEALSAREREVLGLLGAGLTDAEIARRLGIAVGTARWHTKNILAKLGVPNRTQAAIQAHQIGLC